MGIDIFLTAADILIAIALTWFIIWFFLLPQKRDGSPSTDGNTSNKQEESHFPTATTLPIDEELEALKLNCRRTGRLTLVAALLTAPVLILDLCTRFIPDAIPSWTTNPWLQAIVITPVVFYCGQPIYRTGWNQLTHHKTDLSSLVTIATALAYVYSLTSCAFTNLLPVGSRQPYFDVIGTITTLVLFAGFNDQKVCLHMMTNEAWLDNVNSQLTLEQLRTKNIVVRHDATTTNLFYTDIFTNQPYVDKLLSKAEPIIMIVAVWTFMIWLFAGPQPHLAHAVANATSVLIIACPTAIVASYTLTFLTALRAGLSKGILFTSPQSLSRLAKTQTAIIDTSVLPNATESNAPENELAQVRTLLNKIGVETQLSKSSSLQQHKPTNATSSTHAGLIAFATDEAESQKQPDAQVRIAISRNQSTRHDYVTTSQQKNADAFDIFIRNQKLDKIAESIQLARASQNVTKLNLTWGYIYNIAAVLLATGVTYPLWGWLVNPMIATVTALLASLVPLGNVILLNRRNRSC